LAADVTPVPPPPPPATTRASIEIAGIAALSTENTKSGLLEALLGIAIEAADEVDSGAVTVNVVLSPISKIVSSGWVIEKSPELMEIASRNSRSLPEFLIVKICSPSARMSVDPYATSVSVSSKTFILGAIWSCSSSIGKAIYSYPVVLVLPGLRGAKAVDLNDLTGFIVTGYLHKT